MIFKKLTLENFKSHINTEIEFNKGTTIILGDNGSGKSSIFEGINFALYKKYNTKSLNDLINTKADSMSVSLSFLAGNKEYKVIRTRTHKKSTAELFILQDDEYVNIVSGDKEVNNHIEALLEIDADLFLNAIYIKQGEIDSLVTQKASERKKNISKLLRLEKLEVSYKNMANVISNYELKKSQISSLIDDTFQDNKDELISKQNLLKAKLDTKNKELLLLQKELKELKGKINEQNALNITYQQLSNKKTQLETEARSLSNNIDDLRQQIQSLEKMEQILESLKDDISNIDLIQKLSKQIDNKNNTLSRINSIEDKIHNNLNKIAFVDDISKIYQDNALDENSLLTKQIDELGKLIDIDCLENKKAINNIQQQIQQMIVERTKLETIVVDNNQLLTEIKDIQGACPICQSPLDEEHKAKLINNYNNIIQDNSLKLEKRNKELQILQKEEISLNDMLKEKMSFLTKIQNARVIAQLIDDDCVEKKQAEAYLQNIEEEISNYIKILDIDDYDESNIQILYQNLLEKQQKYQEAEFNLKNKQQIQEKYDNIKTEYHNTITNLKEVDDKIFHLNFDSALLQEYQTQQADLQNKYYPLVKEVGQIENDIKYNQIQIDGIDNKIKQNKENKEKIKKMDEFIKFLKDIREIYSKDGLQKDIRLTFKPQIEKNTQNFFNKFNFDYSGLKLSDDYDIVIVGPAGDSDIDMVSGGEKIAIALSLRLGIAQSITSNTIETILLDEPTTYLDEFRKQEFVNVIQDISLVPQMILITHDPELENAADNIITLRKKNGESIIV